MPKPLRVAASSSTPSVAGSIAWSIRDFGEVDIEVIGAAAVNQAVKAITVARSYLALEGLDIFFQPSFMTVTINGEERTALSLHVESRPLSRPISQNEASEEAVTEIGSPKE